MAAPQVQVQEYDNKYFSTAGAFGSAGFVGRFEKGPVDTPTFISSVNEFLTTFGTGVNDFHNDWYQIYNYLQYTSGVWVVRSCGEPRANANNGTSLLIDNDSLWQSVYDSIPADGLRFIARTPGTWGNKITIAVITKPEYDANVDMGYGVLAQNIFTYFEDEFFGICVFFDGKLVEHYYKGANNVEEINKESSYLYTKTTTLSSGVLLTGLGVGGVIDYGTVTTTGTTNDLGLVTSNATSSVNFGLITEPIALNPTGGVSDYVAYGANIITFNNGLDPTPTTGDLTNSHDLFQNIDMYPLDVFIGNERDNTLAINLVEFRKDCIAFIGLPKILPNSSYVVPYRATPTSEAAITAYIDTLPRSIFVHFTGNIKLQYDRFTDKNRLVSLAGDAAGLKTQAAKENPWDVGAGFTRGQIKNSVNMFRTLSPAQMLHYESIGINTTQRNMIASQVTFSTVPGSFNKVNIRSLFNHIEKSANYSMRYMIFENNTERLRDNIRLNLTNLLMNIKSNRGITDAKVDVYTAQNPNEIVVDLYIKPNFLTDSILLRMTNTGTTDFKSVIGQTG